MARNVKIINNYQLVDNADIKWISSTNRVALVVNKMFGLITHIVISHH